MDASSKGIVCFWSGHYLLLLVIAHTSVKEAKVKKQKKESKYIRLFM